VTSAFYSRTSMGADFSHNPVVDVQGGQLELITRAPSQRLRVLDLGCEAGTPTQILMSDASPYHVIGADLSLQALVRYVDDTQRSGIQLDALRLPFADGSFDIVVSDDVIEQLVDTDSFTREISRVLSPNGWLFLSTPNLAAWFNRIVLLFGIEPAFSEVSFEKVFGRPGDDVVGHLHLFTSQSICEFLNFHEYDIVDIRRARFEAIPRVARPMDGLAARCPSIAGNTVVAARKKS